MHEAEQWTHSYKWLFHSQKAKRYKTFQHNRPL